MTSFKSRNIKIAYILSFLSDLYFPISVWIFYYSRFLNFKQIAILTTIKVVASNFFEIPTSAFADIYGRKKSVIVSFVLFALAMFVFAYTFNFWIFVILNVFM
ncbi:hypothetical protein KKE45_04030, partial [Patescibacteria group bacterium]|nr:hypothetical protein [Patescibacteria group bacterium]